MADIETTQEASEPQEKKRKPKPPPTTQFPGRIVRETEVREILGGISRNTLWKWRRSGKFPEPRLLSGSVMGWPLDVVKDWLASRPVAEPSREPNP